MRALGHYLRSRFAILPLLEGLLLMQSMAFGFELRWRTEGQLSWTIHGLAFAGVMMLAMTAFGLYDRNEEPFRIVVQRVLSAYLVTLTVGAVVFYLFPRLMVGRGVFALTSLLALGGLLVIRYAAHRAAILQIPTSRVLVVGDGQEADEVVKLLRVARNGRAPRFTVQVGVHTADGVAPGGLGVEADSLPALAKQRRVSEIVVALRERRGGREPLDQLLACKLMGIRVLDLATFYERELGLIRLDHLRTSWLVYGSGFDQGRVRVLVKRTFDLSVSLFLLLLASPLMLLTALAIRLETAGSILYRQERVRDGGQRFMMLKFRSMRQDAEGDGAPRWASLGDPRVTRVGRFIRRLRIDELPQLINVLKGDMSFVGPRPERPFFVQQLVSEIPYYEIRHNVKPGITGWAQVRLDYGASVEDSKAKLQYDLYYVKHHSLFLDLMILLETVQVVLLGKGAR